MADPGGEPGSGLSVRKVTKVFEAKGGAPLRAVPREGEEVRVSLPAAALWVLEP